MTNFTDTLRISPMNLGFRRKIFNTADAEFFFINTAYLDAYIELLEGIRQHRGLLVLTSEAGIGKTLLLRKLVNEAPAKIKFVFCYSTNLDFNNLLAVISDQLGVMTQGREFSDRLEALKEYFSHCFAQGIDVALLIDDAHHLNEDVLNGLLALSHLEFEAGNTVQIVLSGTPVLEEILAKIQVFHSYLASAVRIRLEPLTTADVAAFISRQVQHADGPSMESLFPLPVIERISHYTGGIPRLINTLCERALLSTQIKGQVTVSIATVDEAASELILRDRTMTSSPVADFPSLEETRSGNTVQVARMEQLLAKSDSLLGEETQSILIGSLSADEPEEHSQAVMQQWDDRQFGKKRSKLFNSTGLQIVLLILMALLAGLLGGTGSVYLYQRTIAKVKPLTPAASTPADITTSVPAPINKVEPPAMPGSAQAPLTTSPEMSTKPVAILEAGSPQKPLESSQAPKAVTETTHPVAKIELPPASPSTTAAKPLETSLISSYMSSGDLLLARGDIVSARLFYLEAANAGSVVGMMAVGKTYDPIILNQLGTKGFRADPVKAAEWYLKAKKAGDSESIERLEELKRWLSKSPALEEIEANNLRELLR
jgi:type II secretory pathway predicted ATPase ExeA